MGYYAADTLSVQQESEKCTADVNFVGQNTLAVHNGCTMNVIAIETDLLRLLPEPTLAVLRERALRESKPLIDVVRDVLNETAARLAVPPPPPAAQMAA